MQSVILDVVSRGIKCFFPCLGLQVLLKHMVARKTTGWCVGLVVAHLFNLNFIFLSDGLMVVAE
jgi:hypothetical protein